MTDLLGTPYLLADESGTFRDIRVLQERVDLLRAQGTLRPETLKAYYGNTRFEQIAESNAIEGSTLSVQETELAVLRGITISGHDPAYARDARQLSKALERLVELAVEKNLTDISQVTEIHSLILGEHSGSGKFRSEKVLISGSEHQPPRTWNEVINAMEEWEQWSIRNQSVPALLRATILHTWLVHIHPFVDGNGRTARAILNLELIRNGYPSVVIRKNDRLRYYEALAESDSGGDLGPMGDLVVQRAGHAIDALERVAKAEEGYDAARAQRLAQIEVRAAIWNDAVRLLYSLVQEGLRRVYGDIARVSTRWYEAELSAEDYLALQNNKKTGNTWSFNFAVNIPGGSRVSYLAWIGFRTEAMQRHFGPGPSIFWSYEKSGGDHRWTQCDGIAPGGAELTLNVPNADRWSVRDSRGQLRWMLPSELANAIVLGADEQLTRESN